MNAGGIETWEKLPEETQGTGFPEFQVPDPFGICDVVGEEVYSAELKDVRFKPGFEVRCFYPNKPLVVGFNESGIVAASYNTFKKFGTVPVHPDNLGLAQQAPIC